MMFALFSLFGCRLERDANTPEGEISTATQIEFLNLDPEVAYVGDEDCALCHSEIFKSFKQTGMGRSFYPLSPSNIIEDFSKESPVYHEASNYHYEVTSKDGEFFQVEYRLDDSGMRVHELSRRIDYVVGSGNHARTYLTEENGFLYELPLTWYTAKKRWGLSPGFEQFNFRFSRQIPEGCMNCHNSYAEYIPYSGNRFTEVPHGISCERCHGPGALHVESRYATKLTDSTTNAIDATIVNPRHLPPALQMDVCYQCHLQSQVGIFKPDMEGQDFRPGMRLQDTKSVYVLADLPPSDLRVASHAERLALSTCYEESAGKLVCITCHNPHEPVQTVARSSFNETCMSCHNLSSLSQNRRGAQHSAYGDCVACHMPQGKTSDVVHVNFTDHWIQKRPAEPKSRQGTSFTKLKDFFGESTVASDLYLTLAYLQYYDDATKDPVDFDNMIAEVRTSMLNLPDNEEGLYRLGVAYLQRGHMEEAAQQFRTLLAINPQNALAHTQLGMVLKKMGRREEAVDSYKAALRLIPENALALTQLGYVYVDLNKPNAAFDCFKQAIYAQPSYAPAHNGLGEFYLYVQNDLVTAKQHLLQALHLDPDHFEVLTNLGNLEMASKNYADAERYFRSVIKINPQIVMAYGNLAFIASLQGRTAESRSLLKRALEIDPENARLKAVLDKIESAQADKGKTK